MALLIYIAQASLYGLLMWAIYCCVWRGRPWHTASRAYLLMSAILPLILPSIHLQINAPASAAGYTLSSPELLINTTSHKAPTSLSATVLTVYICITIVVASFYATAWLRVLSRLRKGSRTRFSTYTIITNTGIGPGTVGTCIFFPEQAIDGPVLQHELAHIRAGHRFDSILIQLLHVFFWMSPALWLIGRELKTVHEFDADAGALRETDTSSYTSLLLSQAFGVSQINIAHLFFHRPLKRRILMLQKTNQPRVAKRTLFMSFIFTGALCGTVLIAQAVEKGPSIRKTTKQPKVQTADTKSDWKNPNLNYMPDGRRIYSSMRELHNWYPKQKKGEGC